MKVFTGRVISTKMSKTAKVLLDRIIVHPLYGKRYRRAKNYFVHDELGAKVGDNVKFAASKPFSRLKKWKMIEILEEKR